MTVRLRSGDEKFVPQGGPSGGNGGIGGAVYIVADKNIEFFRRI